MGVREKEGRGAEEEREVGEEVLVPRVEAVLGEVRGRHVVLEVVEGRDDGAEYDVGPGDGAGGVEGSVEDDGQEGRCEAG